MSSIDRECSNVSAEVEGNALYKIADDPHRPTYHFLPPANWMNDPNGLIQFDGMYHLFYQYNPAGAFHHKIHWGHAISTDLVHWTHLPVAQSPTEGSPDEDGCWSGCSVNDNGIATFIYTGLRGREERPCVATGTGDLRTLKKYQHNPVIAGPPAGLNTVGFRDHCVWQEGDVWYQLIGSGTKDKGGTLLLYRSVDLLHWEYMHPFFLADARPPTQLATATMWECPDFFSLNSTGQEEGRHVLVVSVVDSEHGWYPAHFTGRYSQTLHQFAPEEFQKLDHGKSYYAPQSFPDDNERRIMFGWLREEREESKQREAGWSGVMSLPRMLSRTNEGVLEVRPAPELELLRRRHAGLRDVNLASDTFHDIAALTGVTDLRGDALEISVEFDLGNAGEVGLAVRCSPDQQEQTRIWFEKEDQELIVDTTLSSQDSSARRGRYSGPLRPTAGESVRFRVFLDHSVLEVFGNETCCLTSRIYPSRSDSLDIVLFANGGTARALSLDIWEMQSI